MYNCDIHTIHTQVAHAGGANHSQLVTAAQQYVRLNCQWTPTMVVSMGPQQGNVLLSSGSSKQNQITVLGC